MLSSEIMRVSGLVQRTAIGAGSKTEHTAISVITPAGEYVLRRRGGNAFTDPELEKLVGKQVEFEGVLHGYTLIVAEWQPVATGVTRDNSRG